MQYVRLRLALDDAARHPMHRFAIDHGGYGDYRLLQWSVAGPEAMAFLFHVAGPRGPYVDALADVETVADYSVAPADDGRFYLYVRERMTGRDRRIAAAFARESVVLVPPVEFGMDGTMTVTGVGTGEDLSAAVDELPDEVVADALSVGPYEARSLEAASDLTARQREVVAAAVDLGYYESPRRATVAEVADAVDCSPSTAAEHLRKAESSVMKSTAGP